jgi:hypothetical protein
LKWSKTTCPVPLMDSLWNEQRRHVLYPSWILFGISKDDISCTPLGFSNEQI